MQQHMSRRKADRRRRKRLMDDWEAKRELVLIWWDISVLSPTPTSTMGTRVKDRAEKEK